MKRVTYRDDPEWIAARDTYTTERANNESADEAFSRRRQAIARMFVIETEHESPRDLYNLDIDHGGDFSYLLAIAEAGWIGRRVARA